MPRASNSSSIRKKQNRLESNVPGTRRSTRNASFAQSQSQSLNQSDIDLGVGSPSWLNTQTENDVDQTQIDNSFLSISTASLPTKYKINIGLPINQQLSDNDRQKYYIQGEEVLSDGLRKINDLEGNLEDLRNATKRIVKCPARLSQPNEKKQQSSGVQQLDQNVFWYSARIKYPCVCSLARLNNAYTLSSLPPISSQLSILSQSDDSHIAKDVGDLLPWSTDDGMVDLEPTMEDIEEFEITWNLPRQPSSQISDTDTVYEPEGKQEAVEIYLEKERNRLRKGKFKAIEVTEPILPPLTSGLGAGDVNSKSARSVGEIAIPTVVEKIQEHVQDDQQNWEEEIKRRKSFWRNLIRSDDGFGKMWNILPLPYSHPIRYLTKPIKRKKLKIPAYQLPRTYTSLPHPFHPNLLNHIKASPGSRVYWLIPIHGPIYIPYLNHPLTLNKYDSQVIPSKAQFFQAERLLEPKDENRPKPFPLIWTSNLILTFLESFLDPLYMDEQRPFGALAYSFSGSKPDPFIDLPIPPPIKSHIGYDISPTIGKNANKTNENMVVQPDSGDHLRIYCNLKYALELRTWLHNIKIPSEDYNNVDIDNVENPAARRLDTGNKEITAQGKQEDLIRIFYKTRLTLVGERGEVLVVA
ncbi:uncharacterized protein L201_007066 [Kwoniella dendrophila CBS 6074]|uniref:Uncharacterized protein n=1 Tax=Kwoniella dendrophila CBS 6074 TaxID=1295534 RepID=A0AAX4K5I1_9TREE